MGPRNQTCTFRSSLTKESSCLRKRVPASRILKRSIHSLHPAPFSEWSETTNSTGAELPLSGSSALTPPEKPSESGLAIPARKYFITSRTPPNYWLPFGCPLKRPKNIPQKTRTHTDKRSRTQAHTHSHMWGDKKTRIRAPSRHLHHVAILDTWRRKTIASQPGALTSVGGKQGL